MDFRHTLLFLLCNMERCSVTAIFYCRLQVRFGKALVKWVLPADVDRVLRRLIPFEVSRAPGAPSPALLHALYTWTLPEIGADELLELWRKSDGQSCDVSAPRCVDLWHTCSPAMLFTCVSQMVHLDGFRSSCPLYCDLVFFSCRFHFFSTSIVRLIHRMFFAHC